ncbi:MAG: twin-arginine translocase TatA/TatE family subunit [Candidatus Pacebacteria bacterium]|nr:twin-arginine translocase TatA/TatE family subunit [Candidatus Paceibacterota bacterium]
MFDIGTKEIIIIAVIIVLLFGAKKIPELARGIGDAIRHIRGGFSDKTNPTEDTKKKS